MDTGANLRSCVRSVKRFQWWMICGVVCVLLGAACSPQTSLLLPTIAVIPSDTPSFTPSLSPIPTDTDIPTDTLVPTDTLSPTNTLTLTPAESDTPIPPP